MSQWDECDRLTPAQAYFAMKQVAKWLDTRKGHEDLTHRLYPIPYDADDVAKGIENNKKKQILTQMSADAWHSALLFRLFRGRDPLPEAPPLEHSYPVYPDYPYIDEDVSLEGS